MAVASSTIKISIRNTENCKHTNTHTHTHIQTEKETDKSEIYKPIVAG